MADKQEAFIILSPGFAASENDSTCLPMQQQFVRKLAVKYPHLKLVVLSFQYPYHNKEYNWHGVNIIPFNGRNAGGWRRLFLRRKIFTALKKLQASYNVRGLLSFWLGECALVGKRFGDRNGIRHFCWISGQDAKAQNKYVRRMSPAQHELIALSDFLQAEFQKNHGIRPGHVIPPGMEKPDTIACTRDIDILGVGSLISLKQFDVFVKILAEILFCFPKLRAVLVGEGPLKNELTKMASQLGLENHLYFAGSIPHHEVLDLMSRSKLLVHPSLYEGFSGVCMEALSRGAHVISFSWAMKQHIDHWHIVNTKKEMKDLVIDKLKFDADHWPVSFRSMTDTVHDIMNLFPSTSL